MYEGYIESVYENYGVIVSEKNGYKVRHLFYIFPDMITNNYFSSSRKVKFSLATKQLRGVKVLLAIKVKIIKGEPIKKYKIHKYSTNIPANYHDFIFEHFFEEHDTFIISQLQQLDLKFKEFILKWVLFLESEIKKCIIHICEKNEINIKDIYNALSVHNDTKQIHKKIFKNIKKKYLFRDEFKLIEIERCSEKDDSEFKITFVPLGLYLENTTIDELGKIVMTIDSLFFSKHIEVDEEELFIKNISEMFVELSIIRNACAHGNPFIPLILDDNYSPSYLYDLASVYPKFNSGDNVEEWRLFEPLRWTTRQLTKRGIAPFYHGSLQGTGLYTAKYILINPARRSFFFFLFIIEYYFRFVDENQRNVRDFRNGFNTILPYFDKNEPGDKDNLFVQYPRSSSVLVRINSFIYPLYYDEGFWFLVHQGFDGL